MNDLAPAVRHTSSLAEIESSRSVTEAQAAMIVAQKFPRDIDESLLRIKKARGRRMLAEKSMYAYPRGKQMVEGPSIRLAECIAQNWRHLDYGIRELSQKNGLSEVEAYCWDMETNVRRTIQFTVPHARKAKGKINALTDPRDIYEMVANQGARRLRACILGVIPVDIIEEAITECNRTLSGNGETPIEDRVRKMLAAFDKMGVSKKMIEARLQHKTTAIVESEIVDMMKIYNSIKDGFSKRDEWFTVDAVVDAEISENANTGDMVDVGDPDDFTKTEPTEEQVKNGMAAKLNALKDLDPEAFQEAKAAASIAKTKPFEEVTEAEFKKLSAKFNELLDGKNGDKAPFEE